MTERERWLARRRKGLGASDAAAAIGQSPYKTNVQLWEEKTGRREPPDISDKPYVKYGKEAEAHLRALFALEHPEYRVEYDEFGMIANLPGCPWLFATLDGSLSELEGARKGILEIKTAEILRPNQFLEWDGRVPQHYYIQVLHQLLATGYAFAVLMAQLRVYGMDGKPASYIRRSFPFEREEVAEDLEYLLNGEKTFWKYVEEDRKPPLILPEI